MGQQVACPLCGTLLIVPVIGPQPAFAAPPAPVGWQAPPPAAPPVQQPAYPPTPPVFPPAPTFPGAPPTISAPQPEPVDAEPAPPEEPATVRILCPNGHELHTPMDMIGMQAACPECNAEFLLRYEDSLEYIEQKKAARVRREEAFNQAALKWSIAAAIIVFLALATMMIIASLR